MNKQSNYKVLGIFLLVNFVVWSLVPLLRRSLPMDTMEAVVWGEYSWIATTKHPPFSGILAYLMYCLLGKTEVSMYILSQVCVVVGIVYIYKLAAKLLSLETALLAALLQFGVIYYHFSSVEFNVNVVSLALWPMCAYYFWNAYTENRLKDWLLFGVCAGLNVLNKYICVLQFASFAIFVLADKKILKLLKNYKVYISVLLCVVMVAPHLYWLYEHDFVTFDYFASRSSSGKLNGIWRHLVYPLKFIAAQLMFCGAGLITYFSFYAKNKHIKAENREISCKNMLRLENINERSRSLFIVISAIAPILLFALMSLISGNVLKSMWGFPSLYMFGIFLFYFFSMQLTKKKCCLFMGIMFAWSMAFAVGYGVQCLLTTSNRFTSNCPQIVQMLEQKWQQKVPNRRLEYVGGSEWFVNMVHLYAKSDVKPMVWLSPKNNPWLDKNDFEKKGAIIVTEDAGAYQKMAENYAISEPIKITLQYKNYFAKTKKKDLYYGFYLPEEKQNVR